MQLIVKGNSQYKNFRYKKFDIKNNYKFNNIYRKKVNTKKYSYEHILKTELLNRNFYIFRIPNNLSLLKKILIFLPKAIHICKLINKAEFTINNVPIHTIDFESFMKFEKVGIEQEITSFTIPFWFARNQGSPLPLWYLNNTDICLKIFFNDINLLKEIGDILFEANYLFIEEYEQKCIFKRFKQEYMIQQIEYFKNYQIDKSLLKINLYNNFNFTNLFWRIKDDMKINTDLITEIKLMINDKIGKIWDKKNIKPIESQDIEYCIEENIDEVSLIVNTKNNDYKNLRLEIFGINYNLLRLDV